MTGSAREENLRTVLSEEEIASGINRMADWIVSRWKGERLVLVGVLTGAYMVMADLSRALWQRGYYDFEIQFVNTSSYGKGTESSGEVRMIMDLEEPIEGSNVLIVEDILDTGLTLHYLLRLFSARGPLSLAACALLSKEARRVVDLVGLGFEVFTGIEIKDIFVVGCGLDYGEKYRGVPYLAEVVH